MTRPVSQKATRDKVRFPDACHELTDKEVQERYGSYIRTAVEGMARDVDTFVEMAQAANQIIQKREQLEARKVSKPTAPTGAVAALPAETLGQVVSLYAELGSPSKVAASLNELGVPGARGGRWRTATVTSALSAAERERAKASR